MPSPFPGLDPYLENPELWPEVHHRLITAIAIAIYSASGATSEGRGCGLGGCAITRKGIAVIGE